MLDLDPTSPVPLWAQIESGLRRRIATGGLRAGDPLPSVRDLARELLVNPATVAKAIQSLAQQGVVETRRGEGSFVAPRPRAADGAWLAHSLAADALRLASIAKSSGLTLDQTSGALLKAWRSLDDPPRDRQPPDGDHAALAKETP